MFGKIKQLFKEPSPQIMAMRELEAAQRELLQTQSLNEYSSRMAAYHQDRISRLKRFLQNTAAEEQR